MNKQWYKSKSVLTAVVMGLVGVAEAAGIHIPEYAFTSDNFEPTNKISIVLFLLFRFII